MRSAPKTSKVVSVRLQKLRAVAENRTHLVRDRTGRAFLGDGAVVARGCGHRDRRGLQGLLGGALQRLVHELRRTEPFQESTVAVDTDRVVDRRHRYSGSILHVETDDRAARLCLGGATRQRWETENDRGQAGDGQQTRECVHWIPPTKELGGHYFVEPRSVQRGPAAQTGGALTTIRTREGVTRETCLPQLSSSTRRFPLAEIARLCRKIVGSE